ncbi:Cell wall synthesis KNH1 [Gossypium arboreum]|uniref:Cell wall synthesis KNH1 n=1 Tax=Gossypium arboreum TaxID=29729 RepID=A0A0B0MEP2_GOSAR|nr:Cell wall synthesis KNH1 [Gossypium arboreum]
MVSILLSILLFSPLNLLAIFAFSTKTAKSRSLCGVINTLRSSLRPSSKCTLRSYSVATMPMAYRLNLRNSTSYSTTVLPSCTRFKNSFLRAST